MRTDLVLIQRLQLLHAKLEAASVDSDVPRTFEEASAQADLMVMARAGLAALLIDRCGDIFADLIEFHGIAAKLQWDGVERRATYPSQPAACALQTAVDRFSARDVR